MLKKFSKFAPIPLIVGLVAAAAALVLKITAGQMTLVSKICLIIAIVGLVLYLLLDSDTILTFFKGRQGRHGSNALVLTLAVIGILIIINLFVYNNNVTWDLTADKENSLAQETLDILANLELPVEVKAFYSSDLNTTTAEALFSNFKRESDGNFDYEFIDPYQNPVEANQAGIDRDGTVILYSGDQTETLTSLTEENLINAVIKLQNPVVTPVYVLTGHGEEDFFTSGDYALTELRRLMEAKNYRVETLNLVATPAIPEDAEAIFIAAPEVPLGQNEVNLLSAYLDGGGSLIFFSEPAFLTTDGGASKNPLADYLNVQWGVTLGNDMIVDPSMDPANVAFSSEFGDHPITEAVQGYITFFPAAHSVQITSVSGLTSDNLALSTSQSWAETDTEGILNNEANFDDKDLAGPITIGVALENSSTGARVVVFGDSSFATDSFVTAYGNLDLAIGIVDWAAENENLINITPHETTDRLLLTPSNGTQLAIVLGGLVGIPLFIGVVGIIIAIQRKRSG